MSAERAAYVAHDTVVERQAGSGLHYAWCQDCDWRSRRYRSRPLTEDKASAHSRTARQRTDPEASS